MHAFNILARDHNYRMLGAHATGSSTGQLLAIAACFRTCVSSNTSCSQDLYGPGARTMHAVSYDEQGAINIHGCRYTPSPKSLRFTPC
jgi:hypothetical protein